MSRIPTALRPYAIYICGMSLLLSLAFFRDDQARAAETASIWGKQFSYGTGFVVIAGVSLLAVYAIRLVVPYLLGRFWTGRGKNHTAQAVWKGSVYGSLIPEILLVYIAFKGITTTVNSCGEGEFSNCGWIFLFIVGVFAVSTVLEILGMFVGYIAGSLKDRTTT